MIDFQNTEKRAANVAALFYGSFHDAEVAAAPAHFDRHEDTRSGYLLPPHNPLGHRKKMKFAGDTRGFSGMWFVDHFFCITQAFWPPAKRIARQGRASFGKGGAAEHARMLLGFALPKTKPEDAVPKANPAFIPEDPRPSPANLLSEGKKTFLWLV